PPRRHDSRLGGLDRPHAPGGPARRDACRGSGKRLHLAGFMSDRSSRISGFYKLPVERRREILSLARDRLDVLASGGLDIGTADHMIENVLGVFALPFAVALNFRVDGKDHLVPMVVEEPSVVAAASNAARLVRLGGGFAVEHDPPVMAAQVQLVDVADPDAAVLAIEAARAGIFALA